MTEESGTPQLVIVNPRLRTVLAFSGPVLRGCALRFAPCARHFSPSGLRCSQAHSRLSSVPTIRNSRLATLPLAILPPLLLYKSPKTEAASRGAGQLIAKVVQWKGNGLTDHPKSFALATQFSMVAPHRSQAHSRLSLPYWGLRTGLRFAGPVFRGCGALRAVPQFSMVVPLRSQARLRHSLLHWAYFGLFRALRAASVRPSPLHPFGASTATACFRHWRRPSCAPQRANRFHAFKYFINSLLNCARRYLLMGRRSPLFSSNSQ